MKVGSVEGGGGDDRAGGGEIYLSAFESLTRPEGRLLRFTDITEMKAYLRRLSEMPQRAHERIKIEETIALSPAIFERNRRNNDSVREYSNVCAVDVDGGAQIVEAERIAAALDQLGLSYWAHSTTFATAAAQRLRVWLPLSRRVKRGEWTRFWRALQAEFRAIGVEIDNQCRDLSRAYVAPQRWQPDRSGDPLANPDPWNWQAEGRGRCLDVDGVVGEHIETILAQEAEDSHVAGRTRDWSNVDRRLVSAKDRYYEVAVEDECAALAQIGPAQGRHMRFLRSAVKLASLGAACGRIEGLKKALYGAAEAQAAQYGSLGQYKYQDSCRAIDAGYEYGCKSPRNIDDQIARWEAALEGLSGPKKVVGGIGATGLGGRAVEEDVITYRSLRTPHQRNPGICSYLGTMWLNDKIDVETLIEYWDQQNSARKVPMKYRRDAMLYLNSLKPDEALLREAEELDEQIGKRGKRKGKGKKKKTERENTASWAV